MSLEMNKQIAVSNCSVFVLLQGICWRCSILISSRTPHQTFITGCMATCTNRMSPHFRAFLQ